MIHTDTMAGSPLRMLAVLATLVTITAAVAIGNHNEVSHRQKKEEDHHGGIKMGVKDTACDDGETNLDVDWDSRDSSVYTCHPGEPPIPTHAKDTKESCVPPKDIPWPLHKCMVDTIQYEDSIPIGGAHRPLWPVYGEYKYVPPQRWLHSMEHGAAVFLYHPCAGKVEIERLKDLAKACLRRHIISPSRRLSTQQPFAVVTWGCKLLMASVDEDKIVPFLREHAIKTAEKYVTRDGHYRLGLLHKAELVSDDMDTKICPKWDSGGANPHKLTAEDMKKPY